MESFTIFTSSAMVEHIILYYFPQNALKKWLGIVCVSYRNSIQNKETEARYCSCTKMFLDKVVNFKDFSRLYKEIKYF